MLAAKDLIGHLKTCNSAVNLLVVQQDLQNHPSLGDPDERRGREMRHLDCGNHWDRLGSSDLVVPHSRKQRPRNRYFN